MKPLHHVLETGDLVQVQTVKTGGPSLDWLKNDPPYARTSRARNRISQWYKHADYDQHVSEGRGMLERELHKLGLEHVSYEKINQHTHFHKVDDLLAAIGSGDYKLSKALYPFRKNTDHSLEKLASRRETGTETGKQHSSAFTVQGVGNLLTHLASCCTPVPGDEIKGYITSGRGVSIHRIQCDNIVNVDEEHQNRLIDVDWGSDASASYSIGLEVTAFHRSGLLHDITETLKSSRADVLKVNMETDDEHVTRITLRLELQGGRRPEGLVNRLASVPNVLAVKRGS
jgi:GTP pyrophosphokinase